MLIKLFKTASSLIGTHCIGHPSVLSNMWDTALAHGISVSETNLSTHPMGEHGTSRKLPPVRASQSTGCRGAVHSRV